MQLQFDVSVVSSKEEIRGAKLQHNKRYGWKQYKGEWIRQSKLGVVKALLFYRIIGEVK